MDLLQARHNRIVDAQGHSVRLRGTCVGGWMNMENFINGYPGTEHRFREAMADAIGPKKARFFFDRMIDHFFTEDDVIFLRQAGASVVRLPLNYRHFEDDAKPFTYLKSGFQRLDQAVGWCRTHGLYVILDLHAVPGHQNQEWHSDNATGHSPFWRHPHFQDRFVNLWEALASRYAGNPAIAGYNLMNETTSGAVDGVLPTPYQPDWPLLNRIYRRTVKAIRAVDPKHLIFLEGDYYSLKFTGLEPPFAANLVYSSHNYNVAALGPGRYPGKVRGEWWDRKKQVKVFDAQEGTRFTRKHRVPLWVGEFGAVFSGPAHERHFRLQAMDDQIGVFERADAHWTTWCYKDAGVMGWVEMDPQSEYLQLLAPLTRTKRLLATDSWASWLPQVPVRKKVKELAQLSAKILRDKQIDASLHDEFLARHVLDWYFSKLLVPAYAKRFKGMSETRLDRILQSFALKQCRPRHDLLAMMARHMH